MGNKGLFKAMGVFTSEECEARQEVMYENYATTASVEVQTMVQMVETGILPACAQDMSKCAVMPAIQGERQTLYAGIKTETDKLKDLFAAKPHNLVEEAEYLCNIIKPQMAAVRALVDKAEALLHKGLYPFPTYEELIYSHHT